MMRNLIFCLLMGCVFTVSQAQTPHGRRRFDSQKPLVHDPVMAKEDSTYYIFSTGWGISCISSTDLQTWHSEPNVFAAPPAWAVKAVEGYGGHTWAPDVLYYQGQYHLFYSCSTFGKNGSAIGHAVRSTLNPADTLHPWRDTGMVIQSIRGKSHWNAIDPNVIIDAQGRPWMTFGSFWDGIQLVRLDKSLTKIQRKSQPKTIARRVIPNRAGMDNAVEAPFLFRHAGYYYLFVSFDYCCRGEKSTYKVVVGRSRDIEGPYLDRLGKPMLEGGGTQVVFNSDVFVAAGHSAAYHFDGKDYFLCHGYSRADDGAAILVLRPMLWDAEDWPVVQL